MVLRHRLSVGKERLVNVVAIMNADGEVVDFKTMIMQAITNIGSQVLATLAHNPGVNVGEVSLASGSSVAVNGAVNLAVGSTVALGSSAQTIGKLATNTGVNIGEVSLRTGSTVQFQSEVSVPYVRAITATSTSRVQLPNQAVKGKATVKAGDVFGTVTISDSSNVGIPLSAGQSVEVPCSNLNQLWYQFSSLKSSPILYIVAGV